MTTVKKLILPIVLMGIFLHSCNDFGSNNQEELSTNVITANESFQKFAEAFYDFKKPEVRKLIIISNSKNKAIDSYYSKLNSFGVENSTEMREEFIKHIGYEDKESYMSLYSEVEERKLELENEFKGLFSEDIELLQTSLKKYFQENNLRAVTFYKSSMDCESDRDTCVGSAGDSHVIRSVVCLASGPWAIPCIIAEQNAYNDALRDCRDEYLACKE